MHVFEYLATKFFNEIFLYEFNIFQPEILHYQSLSFTRTFKKGMHSSSTQGSAYGTTIFKMQKVRKVEIRERTAVDCRASAAIQKIAEGLEIERIRRDWFRIATHRAV